MLNIIPLATALRVRLRVKMSLVEKEKKLIMKRIEQKVGYEKNNRKERK